MSQANIERFNAILGDDPVLRESLSAGVNSQAELVERAVAAAQARGLLFTAEEADAWIAAQRAQPGEGELSDAQLEELAGGNGPNRQSGPFTMDGASNRSTGIFGVPRSLFSSF